MLLLCKHVLDVWDHRYIGESGTANIMASESFSWPPGIREPVHFLVLHGALCKAFLSGDDQHKAVHI